jgi:hypothetical protein
MKRVSKLLVAGTEDTNLAVGTITPALLAAAADGAYLLVDPATGIKATSAAKSVELLVKCGDNLYTSGPIKKGTLSEYNRTPFAASAPRIQTTGTLPAATGDGTEYVMYIANKEQDNYFLPRKRFAVVAGATITSASLLGDAFVELIADTLTVTTPGSVAGTNAELGISVANSARVLTFTGIDSASATPSISGNVKYAYEVLFEVAMGDNLETVSVTRTQEPDPGCGVGSVLRRFEEVSKGYYGHLNNVKFSNVAYGTGYNYQTALGSDYDTVVINYVSPLHNNVEGNVPAEEALVIAALDGGALDALGALTVDLETTLSMDTDW